MKPKIHKHKTMRGRISGYSATAYGVEGSVMATPAEAVTQCEQTMSDALARLARGGRILIWRGHTVVISPTLLGWEYWIDTSTRTDMAQRGPAAREDVEDDALHHLAQNLWTEREDDEAFVLGLPSRVQQELRGWIRFQRAYAAARAEGKSDTEAHRIGCEATS
jgi:hypothetical protein